MNELKAPIDYVEIRRGYQLLRAAGAALLVSLGVVGMLWDGPGWLLYVAPGSLALVHALRRLRKPGTKAVTSMLVDITMLGTVLLAMGGAPQAETAVVAYLLTASLLLLSLAEAALVLSYAALWGVLIAQIGPVADIQDQPTSLTLERISVAVFLVLIAALLLSASKVLHVIRARQAEAIEVERRANALKSEFVSMVSHEFRTPLTSIAGFIETLRDQWHRLSDTEIAEFLEIMHREALLLSNLVEDVLVIPRLEAGRMRLDIHEIDIHDTVEFVVGMTGGEKETSVSIPGGVMVNADSNRVFQVLRNLIENAVKYGGDQILIHGSVEGELYRVDVCDNGQGVAEKDRERIFEHFEQATKGDARTAQGIGLGLPIAQRLVRAMGGDLWYEPRFPIGARFCFTLPLARISRRADPETIPSTAA